MMRRFLVGVATLAVLGAIGLGVGLALAGGGGDEAAPPTSSGQLLPECSLVHSVEACEDMIVEPDGQTPIRSDEGIDPDECNYVHNIDACPDAPVTGPISSDEGIDPNECNYVHNIDACPDALP